MLTQVFEMTDQVLGEMWECGDCGNPVLEYLCNEPLSKIRPESITWDYWFSCSNILCKNHYGSGVFQQNPDWVERND
jgi:hypothetical protein